MSDRCERTDLLVDQCACPDCRNLPDPDPQARMVTWWFTAMWSGRCSRCDTPFESGDQIRADGYGNGGWLAECCGEDGT